VEKVEKVKCKAVQLSVVWMHCRSLFLVQTLKDLLQNSLPIFLFLSRQAPHTHTKVPTKARTQTFWYIADLSLQLSLEAP
jgi:hypothetical protein